MEKETKILLDLFKIEGKKGSEMLTAGQVEIFETMVYQQHKRVHIETSTQYGKSLTVALACLIISCIKQEVAAVIAPTTDKAKEIMRYYIEHLGDSPVFESELEKHTKLDRLKQEESKNRIILRGGGGIYTVGTNERNSQKSIESAMGKGCKNVILDEGCLTRDDTEATIYRMLAGKGKDAFYCKIGNPFYRDKPYSHFYESSNSSLYYKIRIDYKQAIAEGRITKEFIEEAKTKPLFDILFEVKFPPKQDIDARGYRYLLSDEAIERCKISRLPKKLSKDGIQVLGSDIGEGNNKSVHTIKQGKLLWVANRNQSKDLMSQVGIIREHLRNEGFIDKIGIGAGVMSRCEEEDLDVTGIIWGVQATDPKRFANLKAENYWGLKLFIEGNGKILWDDEWEELRQIKYKINSSGKVLMESKEDMRERGIKSPDTADSAALCFNESKRATIEII